MKRAIGRYSLLIISVAILHVIWGPMLLRSGYLASGDWLYLFPDQYTGMCRSWAFYIGELQLGYSLLPLAGLRYYFLCTRAFLSGLPWHSVERIVWVVPIVAVSFYAARRLSTSFIGALVYATNTYILMLVGGGQFGVGLAYALAPAVLDRFFAICGVSKAVKKNDRGLSVRTTVVFSLLLGGMIMLDIRLAYILIIACTAYLIAQFTMQGKIPRRVVVQICAGLGLSLLVNAIWLVPVGLTGYRSTISSLGEAYTTSGILAFLSVSRLPQSFSLLHPNWPENIFGKVYHMDPIFLFLPVAAYSFLLFLNSRQGSLKFQKSTDHVKIAYFAILGIAGVFLAKGVNEPFGGMYRVLFEVFPGFVMFRDPTKWYIIIALSYSFLVPVSLEVLGRGLNTVVARYKSKRFVPRIFSRYPSATRAIPLYVFICYFLLTLFPAVFGNLGGTFAPRAVPVDSAQFAHTLSGDALFSRVLWVPRKTPFSYFSATHPAIDASDLLGMSASEVVAFLESPEAAGLLSRWSVRYVVIPEDTTGALFSKNNAACSACREKFVERVGSISWLARVDDYRDMAVFKTRTNTDLFWHSGGENVSYTMISPVEYHIKAPGEGVIHFSQTYDPHWRLYTKDGASLDPQATEGGILAFDIPPGSTYIDAEVRYDMHQLVKAGLAVSGSTLLCAILSYWYLWAIRRKQHS